jgi:hypothetical protein
MAMKHKSRGFTLLIAVIFMSVMLSVGVLFASLGYKQTLLASSTADSHHAFYAADAALECALYANRSGVFNPNCVAGSEPRMTCDGVEYPVCNSSDGAEDWDNASDPIKISLDGTHCADITVYKNSNGTTFLFSQGYSVPCGQVGSNPRVSARGIWASY